MRKKIFVVFLINFLLIINVKSNSTFFLDEDTLSKRRLLFVSTTQLVGASLSFAALDQLWYSKYAKSRFHTFDDSKDWLQMDKIGHATTSYYLTFLSYKSFKWTGLPEKKSMLYGCISGLTYLTAIELMDGVNQNWGFSLYDMGANIIGSGLFLSQQMLWNEQRVKFKFSFHQSDMAIYNPQLLGSNFSEQILKDYNGQTYWVSANIHSFLKKENKFPRWINFAIGYSAQGMIGGTYNNITICNGDINCMNLQRKRQFFLSLDADLTKLNIKSKFLKTITSTFGFIKVPFPAIEFSNAKTSFHWIYF